MSPEFHPPNCPSDGLRYSDSEQAQGNWYSREYLPHYDRSFLSQAITFRLYDALPKQVIRKVKRKIRHLDGEVRTSELHKRVERFLDEGYGNTWLNQSTIADLVQESLMYHDAKRYRLHGWVIMPNHVHVLFTPVADASLSDIVHSWKSFTAQKINDWLDRSGTVWQRGYYDRYVRNVDHFWTIVRYIERNPIQANLCSHPVEWKWSSAFYRKERGIQVMDYDMQ